MKPWLSFWIVSLLSIGPSTAFENTRQGLGKIDHSDPMLLDRSGRYETVPVLTAGMEVPLLVGSFPHVRSHPYLTYRVPGIPDGMGLIEGRHFNWLYLQHEQDGDPSDPEDFQKTVFSSTIDGFVPGARISLVKLTKQWRVVGATLLARKFLPTALLQNENGSPRVAPGSSIKIDLLAREYRHEGHIPSSFCAGTLAKHGFLDPDTGRPVPVWFASEEDDGYSGISWAVFPDGRALPVEGLGISEKENTLPLIGHRPAHSHHTIIVATDDETNGEIYLWVGTPTAGDRNGFRNGELYVMKVQGLARESGPGKFDGMSWTAPDRKRDASSAVGEIGDSRHVTWTRVPESERMTGEALEAYVTGPDAEGNRRATSFLYPEDINEDPRHPGVLYLAANGGADSLMWDDEEERYENPYGRLYRVDLGIRDAGDPSTWDSAITYLLEGGPGRGMSYDNLAVDRNGKVLIAEDLNQGEDEADSVWAVLKEEQRQPLIVTYDTRSGDVQWTFEANAKRHDPALDWERLNSLIVDDEEDEARDADFWEMSGMIEVPSESRPGNAAYLISVQAHSLKPSGLAEGGQVVLARPR